MILHIHIIVGIFFYDYVLTYTKPLFFHNKTLRCNCRGNVQCDETGRCPLNKCERPYIGITCQHINFGFVMSRTYPPKYPNLHDGDDSTCADPPWRTTTIQFGNNSVLFFWVYISRFDKHDTTPNLQLLKDSTPIKITPYYYKVNETGVLIKIAEYVSYDVLKVSNLPNDFCSVDISLGRNLALSGTASQSSTSLHHSAKEAISGYEGRPSKTSGLSCAQTQPRFDREEWWNVRLKYEARINVVRLIHGDYNTVCPKRRYNLQTINSSGSKRFESKYTIDVDKLRQHIIYVGDKELVREVRLTMNKTTLERYGCSDWDGLVFELCEVLIFGEFQCPDGWYGALCETFCPDGCRRDICDPDWGCVGGCNDGWALKGPWCLLKQNERRCPAGTYGVGCTRKCFYCSRNKTTNDYLCDDISGKCLQGCGPEYQGEKCEKIVVGPDFVKPEDVLKYGLVTVLLALTLLFGKHRFWNYIVHKVNRSRQRSGAENANEEVIAETDKEPAEHPEDVSEEGSAVTDVDPSEYSQDHKEESIAETVV